MMVTIWRFLELQISYIVLWRINDKMSRSGSFKYLDARAGSCSAIFSRDRDDFLDRTRAEDELHNGLSQQTKENHYNC
eukprot:5050525-Pyramimonas_sp.AAC.1